MGCEDYLQKPLGSINPALFTSKNETYAHMMSWVVSFGLFFYILCFAEIFCMRRFDLEEVRFAKYVKILFIAFIGLFFVAGVTGFIHALIKSESILEKGIYLGFLTWFILMAVIYIVSDIHFVSRVKARVSFFVSLIMLGAHMAGSYVLMNRYETPTMISNAKADTEKGDALNKLKNAVDQFIRVKKALPKSPVVLVDEDLIDQNFIKTLSDQSITYNVSTHHTQCQLCTEWLSSGFESRRLSNRDYEFRKSDGEKSQPGPACYRYNFRTDDKGQPTGVKRTKTTENDYQDEYHD